MREGPILAKGESVICPGCRAEIAVAAVDITPATFLAETNFEWKPGYELSNGQYPECRDCGARWISNLNLPQLSIHTIEGWRP